MKIDLKANPFFLSNDDIRWVEETFSAMTLDERVGQLFVPLGLTGDKNYFHYSSQYSIISRTLSGTCTVPFLIASVTRSVCIMVYISPNSDLPKASSAVESPCFPSENTWWEQGIPCSLSAFAKR